MAYKSGRVCAACGQLAVPGEWLVAGAVEEGLPTEPLCRNSWCSQPNRPLSAVYWTGVYEGSLRAAIFAYKYKGDLRWAKSFAHMLSVFLARRATWFEQYDVICPVPSFRGPGARRDFGHVELFCAELGWLASGQWPVEQLVGKVAETEPMSAKPHFARRRIGRTTLSGAFRVLNPSEVEGCRVLLVDDVCASGETLLAVSRALRGAGADEVAALVLARASWHQPRERDQAGALAPMGLASGP